MTNYFDIAPVRFGFQGKPQVLSRRGNLSLTRPVVIIPVP